MTTDIRKINLPKTLTNYLSEALNINLCINVELRDETFVIQNNSWHSENTKKIISYMKEIGFKLINSGDFIAIFSNKNLNNLINLLRLNNKIVYLPTYDYMKGK